jgi:phage shock protein C
MYCSNCGKNIGEHPVFCQFCGTRVAPEPPPSFSSPGFSNYVQPGPKRPFARYSADKKIAGVCGGVARYFDLDSSLVRALWLLCVLLGGTGLVAYVVLWIVMPLDPNSSMLPA